MKQWVSLFGYLEGFSFLILLFYAMPIKYIGGDPSVVSIVGAIHGFLFVAYLFFIVLGVGKQWNKTALIHGFVAAVVPAGPFLFEGLLISGEYDLESNLRENQR
jgi:integral membrane protein